MFMHGCVCMHAGTHVRAWIHIHAWMYVHAYMDTCTCMDTCAYMHTCTCVDTCAIDNACMSTLVADVAWSSVSVSDMVRFTVSGLGITHVSVITGVAGVAWSSVSIPVTAETRARVGARARDRTVDSVRAIERARARACSRTLLFPAPFTLLRRLSSLSLRTFRQPLMSGLTPCMMHIFCFNAQRGMGYQI